MGKEIAKTSFAPEDSCEFERRLDVETKLLCEAVACEDKLGPRSAFKCAEFLKPFRASGIAQR